VSVVGVVAANVSTFNNLTEGFTMTASTTRTIGSTSAAADVTETADVEDTGGFSRRKVFAMCSLGVLGAAGLAACGGSSSDGDDAAADSSSSGGSAAAASGTVLAKLSDVPVGGAVAVSSGGKNILVSQPEKGTVAAFSAVCPHQGGNVVVDGKIFRCTLHGSTFKEADGANISGPAAGKPLPTVKVDVSGENIVTQ
jgi:cytochrome b6-f complex iron-sulfur subunit